MKRKNVLALGLALVMSVGMLTGCGGKGSSDAGTTPGVTQGAESTGGTQAEATQGAQAPTEAPEPTAEPTKEATPTPEPTPTEVPDNIPDVTVKSFEVPTNEALQFVKDMKIGWNLGNTFDASECTWLSDELDYESAWCGVKTSARLIQAVKDAGFNTLRLPVSWHNHVSGENHTISEAWLDRVQEVVDMARAADMYVILDIHHDNNTEFLYPSSEYHEQSKHYIKCIWEQLAERFKDYDDKLVFEAMNEPRLVGTNYEWWLNPNDASCKDSVACINELNQLFVDTVRASGGNNATRYLMVPGYCASVDGALNANFILPTDTVENHLIVSVHAYTPYNFALNTKGTAEFDMDKASDVNHELYG